MPPPPGSPSYSPPQPENLAKTLAPPLWELKALEIPVRHRKKMYFGYMWMTQ